MVKTKPTIETEAPVPRRPRHGSDAEDPKAIKRNAKQQAATQNNEAAAPAKKRGRPPKNPLKQAAPAPKAGKAPAPPPKMGRTGAGAPSPATSPPGSNKRKRGDPEPAPEPSESELSSFVIEIDGEGSDSDVDVVAHSPAKPTKAATPQKPTPKGKGHKPAATSEPLQQQQQQEEDVPLTLSNDASAPVYQARNFLIKRLSDPRSSEASTIPLRPSLQTACDKISTALESTVRLGHSNSLLVLGPRGSGKTLAVERAVSTLTQKYNTDPKDPLVGVVRLVGWAHSDDKTAFKEVARQLCNDFQYTFSKSASLGDNIEFLRTMLTSLARAHKMAVFILDEFDAFARKSKQSLLYCLLDALQTSGVQAAVIGITTRHDCMDLMEKRVRSRFSHRTVDVWLPRASRSIAPPENNEAGVEATDAAADILQAMLTLPQDYPNSKFATAHNKAVVAAMKREDTAACLRRWCASHPSLRQLGGVVQLALSFMAGTSKGGFPADAVVKACTAASGDDVGVTAAITALSVLELAMLVAAYRAAARHDKGPINFEMAYHQFKAFAEGGGEGHVDNYTRGAAAKAFDRLLALGLLSLVDARSEFRVGSRQYAPVYVQVHEEELRSGLAEHAYCTNRLRNWFRTEGGHVSTAAAAVGLA